jgi:hypothetical protein
MLAAALPVFLNPRICYTFVRLFKNETNLVIC